MTPRPGFTRLQVRNYRSLADVDVELGPINVLFGPNGAGKSTLLDAIWFVRDCAVRDVALASSERDHGIGLRYDGAEEGDPIVIALSTEFVRYELTLGFSAGRIESLPGELLEDPIGEEPLMRRSPGASRVSIHDQENDRTFEWELREPEKLSLNILPPHPTRKFVPVPRTFVSTSEISFVLRSLRSYHSRSFDLQRLKRFGSANGYEVVVSALADNLWSVLRNVESRRRLDGCYETILGYMSRAFPKSFDGIVIEQTGPNSLYAQFLEKERRRPILASGVSDGQLQLLILLTALFSEGRDRPSALLIDEPETSLHPWALAVLAEAVVEASANWNRQIILATHSPVLLSQFDESSILAVETTEGRTRLTRLNEIAEVQDLLESYAAGSLFMSEVVAGQSGETAQAAPLKDEP